MSTSRIENGTYSIGATQIAYPDHPLRQLADWVAEARPGTAAALQRRTQVQGSAIRWLEGGGDEAVGVHALALALSPAFQLVEPVPGSGMAITFQSGFITLDEARTIRGLWPSVREWISRSAPQHWKPIRDVISEWAYPGRTQHALPDDLREEAAAFALEMLTDLASMAASGPGVVHWAESIARLRGWELPVASDHDFETLFPPQEIRNWQKAQTEQEQRAEELANRWASTPPADIVARIIEYEQQARIAGHTWPRLTPHVCDRIATQVDDCAPWVEDFVGGDAPADLIQPFLRRLLREAPETAQRLARQCLDDHQYRLATAVTVLTHESVPPHLVELAAGCLEGAGKWVETLSMRGELTIPVAHRLLRHPDASIAGATAIGEWSADPEGFIREGLEEVWKLAIVRCSPDEWALQDILASNPDLGKRWLKRHLEEERGFSLYEDQAVAAAVRGLEREERRELLRTLPDTYRARDVVGALIGDDADLFRELLGFERLDRLHLVPLAGYPNPSGWALKAEIALEAGYSVEQLAEAAYGQEWSCQGDLSAMWEDWAKRFAGLLEHPDGRIQQIGEVGSRSAKAESDAARARERAERIRGR